MVQGKTDSTGKRILDRKSEFKTGKLDLPGPLAQPPKCPECTSQRVWKDGLRKTSRGDVQRYLCRTCGYRFSQTESKNHSEPLKKPSSWSINNASTINLDRQVCELLTEDSKNLAKVEYRTEKQAAGVTKPDQATIKGMLVKHAWWMEKEGRKESAITLRNRLLATLIRRGANLLDPDSVKETIARFECQDGTKLQYVHAYNGFAKVNEIFWELPKYDQIEKIPFIPTETELDQLIAASGKKMATLLQLLKETAMRVGEALRLEWIDVDTERCIITFNQPEKRSKPRIFKVSQRLVGMLQRLPKESERIFNTRLNVKQNTFMQTRKKAARALQNPRILKIKFHTFRHWKATTEYHKTKDILHVMKLLGHRNIKNTLIYIDLETVLFSGQSDEFHVKTAETIEEACKLAEVGFDYFTTIDTVQIFRKRK
jgi:integrase